jgi:hypothetical protein
MEEQNHYPSLLESASRSYMMTVFLQTTYGVAHHSDKTVLWVGFVLGLTENGISGS